MGSRCSQIQWKLVPNIFVVVGKVEVKVPPRFFSTELMIVGGRVCVTLGVPLLPKHDGSFLWKCVFVEFPASPFCNFLQQTHSCLLRREFDSILYPPEN